MLEQHLHCIESKFPNSDIEKSTQNSRATFIPLGRLPSSVHPNLGLVVDGRTLAYALDKALEDKFLLLAGRCRSVLCCRSTPIQKGMIVKLVRDKLKTMTLAIGKYLSLNEIISYLYKNMKKEVFYSDSITALSFKAI